MSRPTPLAAPFALALAVGLAWLPAAATAQYVPDPLPPPPPPPIDVTTGYSPLPPTLPPSPAPLTPAPERRTGFSLKMGLGGTYRNLYGIHFGGGDLALSLGSQTKGAAFYSDLALFVGSTASGLTTSDIMVGFRAEGRIGARLRIGGGASFSLLIIRRITNESTIFDFTVGPAVHATFDLAQWDDAALYVGLKGGFGWLALASNENSGMPLMGNATLGLGFRY
ncbi:MAG TPA: hypothetical protein VGK67_27835 [Myxococcales bacterium]|jgi:hypothetical protein